MKYLNNSQQIKNKFIQFLINNNAYKKFIYEYKRKLIKHKLILTNKNDIETYINPFLDKKIQQAIKEGKLTEFINFALIWSSTKDGFEFWENLDLLWRKQLKADEND